MSAKIKKEEVQERVNYDILLLFLLLNMLYNKNWRAFPWARIWLFISTTAVSPEVIKKMKNTDEIKWCQIIFGDELSKGQGRLQKIWHLMCIEDAKVDSYLLWVLQNNRPPDLDRCNQSHSKQHLHFNVIFLEGLTHADRQVADTGTATSRHTIEKPFRKFKTGSRIHSIWNCIHWLYLHCQLSH